MRLTASILFVLVMLTGSAFAQTVSVDYDREYDYETRKIKTFAWVESSETSVAAVDPLLHSRIVNGIEYYLSHAGMTQVDVNADPDIHVTYHASSKEEVHVNTTTMGYGYPGGWVYGGYYGGYGMGGVGTATTSVSTYQTGTLVVDVWDAKSEKLVWRGMASNIVVTQNPEKMEDKIDKALKKMVDKWGKIKQQNAKEKAKAEKKAAKEAAKG
jgi:hypothetical protein